MESRRITWAFLPLEIRLMILKALEQSGASLACSAAVSREWQAIIEPKTFHLLRLTPSRLAGFYDATIHPRRKSLVKFIWFCIELQDYDCSQPEELFPSLRSHRFIDTHIIEVALHQLFLTLSKWEKDPCDKLWLDISVHSPRDMKYDFRWTQLPSNTVLDDLRCEKDNDKAYIHNPHHDWFSAQHTADFPWNWLAQHTVFADIKIPSKFWSKQPKVTAVTGLLLRRQTRRRWEPRTVEGLCNLFPGLSEIYYEPWREWERGFQREADKSSQLLFKSFISNRKQLRRMVLFEDFNDHLISRLEGDEDHHAEPIRTANVAVCRILAETSTNLEHFSASFIVDATHFFAACQSTWVWDKLEYLSLTSRVLVSDESHTKINDMLQKAATVATKMPRLKAMEVWNGAKNLACSFQYDACSEEDAVITWRANWALQLEPRVLEAWEAVRPSRDFRVIMESLDVVIKSHGDAVHYLKQLYPVAHPVSLWQIQQENGTTA